jgi:hypothetical protein
VVVSGCVSVLLEAVNLMLRTPSILLTYALEIIEVLGAFRYVQKTTLLLPSP